jgi:hypothetical protein
MKQRDMKYNRFNVSTVFQMIEKNGEKTTKNVNRDRDSNFVPPTIMTGDIFLFIFFAFAHSIPTTSSDHRD